MMDPYIKEIYNTLEEQQKLVGGLVECVELEKNVGLLCNKEGKKLNLEMNRIITNNVICGNFFIAGKINGESVSLTLKQIKQYKSLFKLRDHTIAISLLKNQYQESSNLLKYDLTGIEKLLQLGNLLNGK